MELLAPAGNFDALKAAVQNGADAVYLGFGGYNARRSAGNFSDAEFFDAVEYCHARGVKVHVTLNTLVKQNELDGFVNAARTVARAGADAAIVQDLGGAQILKELCPGVELHMSTQAACYSADGAKFAKAHGYDRVVLARECSLDEIRECVRQGIDVETFVHGALCVCFSGQCLLSSMVGGRSGNRGMCAQPCRLNYKLTGNKTASGCLLSPKDIMLIDRLPELKRAGVASLKIEGRLKRPEYVAEVTRVYRRALDMLEENPDGFAADERDVTALKQIFNRGGFSQAYIDPDFRDADITDITRPNNMGVHVGRVLAARNGRLKLQLDTSLNTGDQISLRTDNAETGFELREELNAGMADVFAAEIKRSGADPTGAEIFRAASSVQLDRAKHSTDDEHRAISVNMRASILTGKNSALEICAAVDKSQNGNADIADITGRATGAEVSPARKAPLSADGVRAQLAKTGGTAVSVNDISLELSDNAFMPMSVLNELRREAVDNFMAQVIARRRSCPADNAAAQPDTAAHDNGSAHGCRVVVQSRELCDAALGDEFYWEPEYVDADRLQSDFDGGINGAENVYLRVPNMLSSAELAAVHNFATRNAARLAGCVLTNAAQLALAWPGKITADMNLPAWNSRAEKLLRECGITRMTASLELMAAEINEISRGGAGRELIIYGRAELMTLRHCPVNARNGLAHGQCRLCDSGRGLEGCTLTDRKNVDFALRRYRGQSGCYVHVLNSAPHDLIGRLERLPECEAVRLIFTDEDAERRGELAQAARMAVAAQAEGGRFAYKAAPGATNGHYFRGVD